MAKIEPKGSDYDVSEDFRKRFSKEQGQHLSCQQSDWNSVEIHRLSELHGRIAELEAVPCSLSHETLRLDPKTSLLERAGFCARATPRVRVGCAHTTARYLLEKAILTLEDVPYESRLFADLTHIASEIHSLDRQKDGSRESPPC